jgi:hypothetical protein
MRPGPATPRRGGRRHHETERLIASDKVEGTAVYNRPGRAPRLGLHRDDRQILGQVAYAVMSFGGFLGVGGRFHTLPWQALRYDPRVGGYVADVTREQRERAPSYARDEAPWDNPGYGRSIYDYYGMTYPYAGI